MVVDTGGLERRAGRPDRGAGPGAGAPGDRRGRRHRLRRRCRGRPDAGRPRGGRAPAPRPRRRSSSRSTRPTTSGASSRRPSSTPSAGRRRTRSARSTAAASATCSTRSSGRCRPRSRGRDRAQASARPRPRSGRATSPTGSARADRRRRRADDGPTTRTRTRTTPTPIGRRPTTPPAWDARDRRRVGRRAGRDRDRRPPERRQVEPAQRAARRGAGDRQRHPGHDARRDRHAARVGPQRGRPDRHGRASGGAARSPRARPPSAISTLRALRAIARADVAVLVIDAVDGLTAQDAHVAGYVVEEGKGLVVAVNKWDLVEEKTDRTFDEYVDWHPPARRRSSTSRRSSRSAPRPASASGACSRRRSTSGASAAGASRPASSTGSLGEATRRQVAAARQGPPAEALLRDAGGRRAADVRLLRPRGGLASTSATGATSRTGCARRSASTARRSGSSSASAARSQLPRPRGRSGVGSGAKAGGRSGGVSRAARPAATEGQPPERSTGPPGSPSSARGVGHDARRPRSRSASRSCSCRPPTRPPTRLAGERQNKRRLPGIDVPAAV